MLISTTTAGLLQNASSEASVQLIHDAGFPAYDYYFQVIRYHPVHPSNGPEYLEYAQSLRRYADSLGIVCNQAHAPYHSSRGDAEWDAMRFDQIVRAMEAASVLGAPRIVVHPLQHLPYRENRERLFEMNMEFYSRLLPYAERFQIKIALENMWKSDAAHVIYGSTCADPEEFCRYVDTLNSPYICACLDIGHAGLTADPAEMIRALGPRLEALHVHDNDLKDDAHLMPGLGRIDYVPVMAALQSVGYAGDFTYEAQGTYQNLPEDLQPMALKLMLQMAEHLIA